MAAPPSDRSTAASSWKRTIFMAKDEDQSASSSGEEGIPFDAAERIALHAIGRGHEIPGHDSTSSSAARTYAEYVYDVGKRVVPHVLDDDTRMFYDSEKDAIVIYNPGATGNEGTVFVPTNRQTGESRGLSYYLESIMNDRSPTF